MIFAFAALAILSPALLLAAIRCLIDRQPPPADAIPSINVERYRPMFRLLDEGDIRFLLSQPGGTPALIRRLRQQRCQLFRAYLSSLNRDFGVACQALVQIAAQSTSDRRDLLRALMVSRAKFSLGVFRVRCRLFFYRWDVGHEPVARLLRLFEGLQVELHVITTATPQPF
jgi:hypothetical protein